MAGHSKWAQIKRKKAVNDNKRGQHFTKLIREITVAARSGGGDPAMNPRLRLAVDTAKAGNMPAENIDRAIRKGTGDLEGVDYQEVSYEGYGPGGVAIYIETLTDNANRTVSDIRYVLSRNDGSMGTSGSVAWQFERKGVIILPKTADEDELMLLVLDAGAEGKHLEAPGIRHDGPVPAHETVEVLTPSGHAQTAEKRIHKPGFPAPDRAPEIHARYRGSAWSVQGLVTRIQRLHGVLLCKIEFETLVVYGLLIGG